MRKALYILGQLCDEDLDWLLEAGHREDLLDGDLLIEEGVPASMLYFVLNGEFGVFLEGSHEPISRLYTGEIVGEMSFVDAHPPSATVRATEASIVYAIPRVELFRKLERDDGFGKRFYRAVAILLSDRLRATERRGSGINLDQDQLDDDELDPNVLDNVHLAGSRFEHLIQRMLNLQDIPS